MSQSDELRLLNQSFPDRYPFLLQSTAQGGALGRFDILFAEPGDTLTLSSDGQLSGSAIGSQSRFLPALDELWRRERTAPQQGELPFHGGWFLYLGYELAAEIEPGLRCHKDPLLPTAFAVRCRAAIILDHLAGTIHRVSESNDQSFERQVRDDLAIIGQKRLPVAVPAFDVSEDEPEQFLAAVSRAKQYIEAGDIYQANLSRQWSVSVAGEVTAERIYASLCAANPGPFAGIARWRGTSIISSSPERLLKVGDGEVSTRPIAGTRPRGASAKADDALRSELFAHPKERAEHVMLIDLERNDLGRISIAGSVEVNEMMVLESYAHVHHIVSNVRGRLRANVTPGDAIAAVFPGGTITGCPKVRCMEIISELELAPRGAYTGSFGYLNRDGSMDLNILIRTIVKHGNDLTFRAGAGIVADSDPEAELSEARAKAEGMLRALQNG
ncbi:MAG TPA: aminodeoxychorismate synthase component I [Woeseiaceae bacterium]|nr:aminodeoxychorismate synthase component I [Woeseiaceae bacterium]